MKDLHRVTERDVDRHELGYRRGGGVAAGRLDEEVQQRRLVTGARDEHVAAGAEARQERLRDERRQHRGDRGVDGVATLAQHPRSRLRGQRMAGGDDATVAGASSHSASNSRFWVVAASPSRPPSAASGAV
jgi:hypothetical protein